MSAITGSSADDRALEQLLGESPARCRPTRWGFDATTRLVTMTSGREVVMQVRVAGLEGGRASLIRTTTGVLRAVGIEVPRLIGSTASAGRELLLFEFVPGSPGPELLADPVLGPALAGSMGRLVRSLAATGTSGIAFDDAWIAPAALRCAGEAWLDGLGRDAWPAAVRGTVADRVERALGEVGRSDWKVVVSHGDFVPANVLVATDGSLTLLDLGDVAARHPALDVAWWMLVVRHHHADVAPALIRRLQAEAWVSDRRPDDRLLASLALLRALHLAAGREPGDQRRHLLDLAAAAMSWTGGPPNVG